MAQISLTLNFLVWSLYLCVCDVYSSEIPVRPYCPPATLCVADNSARNEHFYVVEGKKLIVIFLNGEHLELTCPENITLENESLPRFEYMVNVETVILTSCPPPVSSYSKVLATLNVTVTDRLYIKDVFLTPEKSLFEYHFQGLPATLWKLSIEATISYDAIATLNGNFRFNLHLLELSLSNFNLSPQVLLHLPIELQSLELLNVTLEEFPAETLKRLVYLERLLLYDKILTITPVLTYAESLTEVSLNAPLKRLPFIPRVKNVTIFNENPNLILWSETNQRIWGECKELQQLIAANWLVDAFPDGWLANCSQLDYLDLSFMPELAILPQNLLNGAYNLRSMKIRNCRQLTIIPDEFFSDLTNLRELDLSYNSLRNLSSGLFSSLDSLVLLDLSDNFLTHDAGVPMALKTLMSVQQLSLARNPLGDLCDSMTRNIIHSSVSPVSQLSQLTHLNLMETEATKLCADWREMKMLTDLDLRNNNITILNYNDFQFRRAQPSQVDLRGNPVSIIRYTWTDYKAVISTGRATQIADVTVHIDSKLDCDCNSYWFARALHVRPTHITFPELICHSDTDEEGVPLTSVSTDKMVCVSTSCAANCSCTVRPRESGGEMVARCEHVGLTRMPHPPDSKVPPIVEIHVAHNYIENLQPEDLPDTLHFADLSDNKIRNMSSETVAALFSKHRHFRLARNPLACDCYNRPLLIALQAFSNRIVDYVNMTCADGRPVMKIDPNAICTSIAAQHSAIAVAVVALTLVTVAALLTRVRHRLVARLKAGLLARGLCVRWALRPQKADSDQGDEDKQYDVFVSFAHGDEQFIVDELVPRLEQEYKYRACVHYRDFVPGEMIHTQIESSVRNSRRTLVILSDRFALSTWGRAEFRMARAYSVRDSRPRLVVMLLDNRIPNGLGLEWRQYLETNTYLRRDDPWFWERLKFALGRPRASGVIQSARTSTTEITASV